MFLYLLHTLSHSQGFKGDCEAKITFPVISWELDIYQVKASLLGGVQKLLYCWLSLFSVLFRDICFFPANNYNTIQYNTIPTESFFSTSLSLQIMFFGLEFQFPFGTIWILRLGFLQCFVVSFLFLLLEILFPLPSLTVFILW